MKYVPFVIPFMDPVFRLVVKYWERDYKRLGLFFHQDAWPIVRFAWKHACLARLQQISSVSDLALEIVQFSFQVHFENDFERTVFLICLILNEGFLRIWIKLFPSSNGLEMKSSQMLKSKNIIATKTFN